MRKLFNSGPAIYQDDIATRDIRRLKKVLLKLNSFMIIRAVFNWVSKLIQDYSGFALFRFVIGPENLRLLLTNEIQLNQSWFRYQHLPAFHAGYLFILCLLVR